MPNINDTPQRIVGNLDQIVLTIPATADTNADPVFSGGNTFLAMQLPANFTSGNIIFMGGITKNSLYQLTDADGDLLTISQATITAALAGKDSAADGIQIPLDPAIFSGIMFLKIKCSVAQAEKQNIVLVMAPVLGT